VLSACAPSASQAPAGEQKVTLKVLVHQNPPMVEFMEAFYTNLLKMKEVR
jgi:hypothetical protein